MDSAYPIAGEKQLKRQLASLFRSPQKPKRFINTRSIGKYKG